MFLCCSSQHWPGSISPKSVQFDDHQFGDCRKFLSRKRGQDWKGLVEGDGSGSLDEVSPYRLAAQLNRPLLLAHGTEDTNVPFSQFRSMRDAAAKGAPVAPQLLVIEDEGHSFSSPENEGTWYEALEKFLAEHNPAD
ncbi:MAG: prolyl oligopeptidase family serine peptidase [Sphingomonadaceae bacterium]|nr:prolyl oligopeptidase family serine peptidase [Sphingomonadaceae bacterium]